MLHLHRVGDVLGLGDGTSRSILLIGDINESNPILEHKQLAMLADDGN